MSVSVMAESAAVDEVSAYNYLDATTQSALDRRFPHKIATNKEALPTLLNRHLDELLQRPAFVRKLLELDPRLLGEAWGRKNENPLLVLALRPSKENLDEFFRGLIKSSATIGWIRRAAPLLSPRSREAAQVALSLEACASSNVPRLDDAIEHFLELQGAGGNSEAIRALERQVFRNATEAKETALVTRLCRAIPRAIRILSRNGSTQEAVNLAVGLVDVTLKCGQFEKLDEVLRRIEPRDLALEIPVAFLATSKIERQNLPARQVLFEKFERVLHNRNRPDADQILQFVR